MIVEEYYTEGIPEYVEKLFPAGFKGVCVDVGANHPLWISNSWIFEKAGWECWCIEPNPTCISLLKKHRKHVLQTACGEANDENKTLFVYWNDGVDEAGGTGMIERPDHPQMETRRDTVTVRTLDWLMEHEIKRDHIDYLSIDVERGEMLVLRGTDLKRWNPMVITVELHEHRITGHELEPGYLESRGYHKLHRISHDEIYVRD